MTLESIWRVQTCTKAYHTMYLMVNSYHASHYTHQDLINPLIFHSLTLTEIHENSYKTF